jgi:esterase/lipase superfamily enzyme
MYVSENDGPLRVSQEVHGEPRIGEAGEFLTLFEGVETIDISAVPRRDIYRHNYHYFNERVIEDLSQLLTGGVRAGKRSGLREQTQDGKPYWEMLE